MNKIQFYTVASENNHHLDRLLTSAKKHHINIEVLGIGEPYQGNGTKINLLINKLKRCKPNQIFLFVDAYDAIFLTNEDEIKEKYLKYFKETLVFGGEQNFGMYCANDIYYYTKYPIKSGNYRYLNTGTIIGTAKQALTIYEKMNIKNIQKSDQKITIPYYTKNPLNISIDQKHDIFAVNGGRAGLEEIDYTIQNKRLYSNQTDSWPCILHVPGKHFIGLDKIAYQLGYMSKIPLYSEKEKNHHKSITRDHLICHKLGIDNYPYRLIKNWSVNFIIIGLLISIIRYVYIMIGS